jgi:hypothetical protein
MADDQSISVLEDIAGTRYDYSRFGLLAIPCLVTYFARPLASLNHFNIRLRGARSVHGRQA